MSNDLISRRMIRKAVEVIPWYGTNDKGVLHTGAANEESACVRYADVGRAVEMAGAVEAEPVVHAHWEEFGVADYKCSRCGFRFTSADPITMFVYCRCGAHMDEEVADARER